MKNDIRIEPITTMEAELLSKVALRAYADHYLHLWYDGGEWYMEKSFSVEQLGNELNNPNSRFFLAYYSDTPVGFLKVNIDAPLEGFEEKNALELERIYLNKEVAGQGIGTELVNRTFEIAREHHKNMVWLKAMDTSDGSIAFYKKMGFTVSGTYRLKHAPMKEELRGMVVMTCEL